MVDPGQMVYRDHQEDSNNQENPIPTNPEHCEQEEATRLRAGPLVASDKRLRREAQSEVLSVTGVGGGISLVRMAKE